MVRKTKKQNSDISATAKGVEEFINKERKVYSNEWEKNANHFSEKGYYKWMADFIKDYNYILEVGTGIGAGTLELAKKGHKVVSIDENPECLKIAYEKLKDNGISVVYFKREKIIVNNQNQYSVNYDKLVSEDLHDLKETVILIEGDFLNDQNMINKLKKIKKFDAVICWLIGSHGSRRFNKAIVALDIPTPQIYRLKVQNKIYELSDKILREKGVLHIVDRSEFPNKEEEKESFINSHKEQASVTSLEFKKIDFTQYEEPSNGVKMCISLGISGRIPEKSSFALASFISEKP